MNALVRILPGATVTLVAVASGCGGVASPHGGPPDADFQQRVSRYLPRVLVRRKRLQLRRIALRDRPTVLVLLLRASRLSRNAPASRQTLRRRGPELHLR